MKSSESLSQRSPGEESRRLIAQIYADLLAFERALARWRSLRASNSPRPPATAEPASSDRPG